MQPHEIDTSITANKMTSKTYHRIIDKVPAHTFRPKIVQQQQQQEVQKSEASTVSDFDLVHLIVYFVKNFHHKMDVDVLI
jgi:hypothetical protein